MTLPVLAGVARLTGDPELRFAQSGTAVGTVNLAFNSRRRNQQTGEWEDADVFFVKATAFRELAENLANTLHKGAEVVVTGRMKTEQWTNQDGDKRTAPALLLDSIGPSLRFATAAVTKTGGGSNGRAAGGGDEPWPTAGASATSAQDEEPPF